VVACFPAGNHLDFCAEFAAFVRDDFADAIHGGFVVGRGFCFNELFEKVTHKSPVRSKE